VGQVKASPADGRPRPLLKARVRRILRSRMRTLNPAGIVPPGGTRSGRGACRCDLPPTEVGALLPGCKTDGVLWH